MVLPFEHDSLELLEACAMALLPLQPAPAASEELPKARSGASPKADTLWQRLPGGSAVLTQPGGSPAWMYGQFSPEQIVEKSVGISAEALSRAVERDARRYETY